VEAPPVGLDDEALAPPHEVDGVVADERSLLLGERQPEALAEQQEASLQLGLRAGVRT
jgi:hypothetical protein